MTKQEMVIKVPMNGAKARSKAPQIAFSISGVESVALGEKDKNQIVVVGEDVDAVELTNLLRKKLSKWPRLACFRPESKLAAYADLVSLADVETKSQSKAAEKPPETNPNPIVWQCPPPPFVPYYGCYHDDPWRCSIM